MDHPWKVSCKRQSFWWCDIRIAINNDDIGINWFGNNVSCKLGRSFNIKFWNNRWCEEVILKHLLSDIFEVARISGCKISEVGYWDQDVWTWNISNLLNASTAFVYVLISCRNFDSTLLCIEPNRDMSDSFVWWRDSHGFSVRSTYETILNSHRVSTPLDTNKAKKFKIFCASNIPNNILFFCWKLFLARLKMRDEFAKCGVFIGAT